MIDAVVVLLMVAALFAAPVIILLAWVAVIVLAFHVLRYIVPLFMLLLVATALLGCAKPAPVVTAQATPIPDQLLGCKPEPMPPATGSQRQVASYVLDLADAGEDCRQKLGAVKSIEAARHAP